MTHEERIKVEAIAGEAHEACDIIVKALQKELAAKGSMLETVTRCNCPGPCNAHGCILKENWQLKAEVERLKADIGWRSSCTLEQQARAEAAELQVREVWDLLTSMPSGPGEGMDSDAEDVKAQAEWSERFRAMEAKLGKGAENRFGPNGDPYNIPEPRYCVKCGRLMEAADAAHVYTCEGKGNAANPAPFIEKRCCEIPAPAPGFRCVRCGLIG